MRTVLIVLCVILGAVAATKQSYSGYKIYQVTPSTINQLKQLVQFESADGYDFWSRGKRSGASIDIMVAPQQQQGFDIFLLQNKIQHFIIIDNVQTVFDAESIRQAVPTIHTDGKIGFQKYYRHAEINAYLDELAVTYPELVTVSTIGKSTENREMKLIKISNGGTNNPIIWIDGGMHAREWISPAMALYIINQLVETDGENSVLLDGVDWHILPVLNPDGYEFSHTNTRLWRKTRSVHLSTTCPGVDGNRNFDFKWNGLGTSQDPCSEIYSGPSAASEPEVVAVTNYLSTNQAAMYIALHSYGEYLLYPWGYTSELPSDWRELEALAKEADAAQVAAGGNPYEIGSSTNVLSPAAGCSDDWAKGPGGIAYSYTVELPGGGLFGFDLPASRIESTVTTLFEAIRVFGNFVRENKKLVKVAV